MLKKLIGSFEPNPKFLSSSGVKAALALVFGSIATSPVYLPDFLADKLTSPEQVVGALSIVFYTILTATLIYTIVLMKVAKETKQGSIFAVAGTLGGLVLVGVLLNVAAMFTDCSITPVVSIKSALEELKSAGILTSQAQVVYATDVVLAILLFSLIKGISAIAKVTGPAMIVYMVVGSIAGVLGIMQAPEVLKAFNPYYAYEFIASNPWSFVGGVLVITFLCVTGKEAEYIDAPAIGTSNIQVGWAILLPFLLITYSGQCAIVYRSLESGSPILASSPWYESLYLIPGIEYNLPLIKVNAGIIITALAVCGASYTILVGGFGLHDAAFRRKLLMYLRQIFPTRFGEQMFTPVLAVMFLVLGVFLNHYYTESAELADPYSGIITVAMLSTLFVGFIKIMSIMKTKPAKVATAMVLFVGMCVIGMYAIALIPETMKHGGGILPVLGFWILLMYTILCINRKKAEVTNLISIDDLLSQANEVITINGNNTPVAVVPVAGYNNLVADTYTRNPITEQKVLFVTIVRDLHHANKGWNIDSSMKSQNAYYVQITVGSQETGKLGVYVPEILKSLELGEDWEPHMYKRYADSYLKVSFRLRDQLLMGVVHPIFDRLFPGPEQEFWGRRTKVKIHYVEVGPQHIVEGPGNLRLE